MRRELPSTLVIEVTERRAVASALMGALYLVDDDGHPFKRATFAEADGLPVITGVTRDQYAAVRRPARRSFARRWRCSPPTDRRPRPPPPKLSEIHVDPRDRFSLVLLDGGGEIRLGAGHFEAKLARFDRIFARARPPRPAALTTVYLDGPLGDRVAEAGRPLKD